MAEQCVHRGRPYTDVPVNRIAHFRSTADVAGQPLLVQFELPRPIFVSSTARLADST
jgi:hypothetical protein